MGPTSFNVGDLFDINDVLKWLEASMGPTSFNVGDKRAQEEAKRVDKLQWGRRLSTSETSQR